MKKLFTVFLILLALGSCLLAVAPERFDTGRGLR